MDALKWLPCLLLLAASLPAAEPVIEGLRRTRASVVQRELALDAEQPWEERLQRLKNLQIFARVEGDEAAGRLRLEDKWTLIPIVKAGGGGGTAFYTVGLYDVNWFGRYLEAGAQFESLGGIPSGVAWFRDPRFLDRRLRLGVDVWHQARNLTFYDWGARLAGGATLMRNKAHVFVDHEWTPWFSAGIAWELNADALGAEALGDDVKAANAAAGYAPSGTARASLGRLYATLGRLDYDGWLLQGQSLDLGLERASGALGGDQEFSRGTAELKAFQRVGEHNFGLRLAGSWSDAAYLGQQAFLGGLDSVRGYIHGRFQGRVWWLLNLEWRLPLYASESLVVQGVGFWDAARAAQDLDALNAGGDGGQGAGGGLRMVFPKVYRLNIRADYGRALDGSEQGLSFGLQQFF